MFSLATSPYNATLETHAFLSEQCFDYMGFLWSHRVSEIEESQLPAAEGWQATYTRVKHFVMDLLSEFSDSFAELFPTRYRLMSIGDFAKVKALRSYFVQDRALPSIKTEWGKIFLSHKQKIMLRDCERIHPLTVSYVSPLFRADLDTLRDREEQASHYSPPAEVKPVVDQCPNLRLNPVPFDAASYDPSSGQYRNIQAVFGRAPSEFLAKLDELLAFGNLKIINKGISASLMIYDAEGKPFAIFKPDEFAGGARGNPKGVVNYGSIDPDATKQPSLKEVAAHIVMRGVSCVPESSLVRINLGGKIYQGSVQAFVAHTQSFMDLSISLSKLIYSELGIEVDPAILEKVQKGQFLSEHEQRQQFQATQLFMQKMANSVVTYKIQKKTMELLRDLYKVSASQVQWVGLHQLLCGNSDFNPDNFLLDEQAEQTFLIPIDFNLAFPSKINPFQYVHKMSSWATLKMADLPLHESIQKFFENYDIDSVADQLYDLGLNPQRIFSFKIRATTLKQAITSVPNITLSQILDLFVSLNGSIVDQTVTQIMEQTDESGKELSFTEGAKSGFQTYVALFQKEMDAYVERLKDVTSRESMLHRLRTESVQAKSLLDYDPMFRKLLSLETGMGDGELSEIYTFATDHDIQEDEEQMCLTDPRFTLRA